MKAKDGPILVHVCLCVSPSTLAEKAHKAILNSLSATCFKQIPDSKMFKGDLIRPNLPCKKQNTYLDALLLIRALRLQVGLVFICALHTQEAVGCVANPTGQHAVPQHGVHHCAFTITGPKTTKK